MNEILMLLYKIIPKVKFCLRAVVLLGTIILTACSSTERTTLLEQHQVERLISSVDSVVGSRTVVQQDSAWHELVLTQFKTISERSDTSHTLVVDTAGRVIKETLIINNVRESASESERLEREQLQSRLLVMDSTLQVVRHEQQLTDSLLRVSQKETVKVIEKPLSPWKQLRLWLANIVLVALAVLAAVWFLRKHIVRSKAERGTDV